jgi:hypothetical protein
VLAARDKYLVPGGLMLPDKATLYLAAIEDGDYKEEKLEWWDNVYGFKMSCLKELAYLEPVVDCIDPRQMISQPAVIKSIDINTCTVADLDFTADFELVSEHTEFCHALVGWFDTSFSHAHKPLVLKAPPPPPPPLRARSSPLSPPACTSFLVHAVCVLRASCHCNTNSGGGYMEGAVAVADWANGDPDTLEADGLLPTRRASAHAGDACAGRMSSLMGNGHKKWAI